MPLLRESLNIASLLLSTKRSFILQLLILQDDRDRLDLLMNMTKAFVFLACSLMIAALMGCGANVWAAQKSPVFTLREHIGKTWEKEVVTYTLTAEQVSAIKGKQLVDQDDRPVVYQLDDMSKVLSFQATLQPFGSMAVRFIDASPASDTDLKVVETDTTIELSNALTGVRIAKSISGQSKDIPLKAWRLASGKWVGEAGFTEPQTIKTYTAKIVEQGPVRVRVVCDMTFDDGDSWSMTFELQAREPAVLIDENFECSNTRSITFDFAKEFDAARVISRISAPQKLEGKVNPYGYHFSQDLAGRQDRLLVLTPWVHWGGSSLVASHFNLVDADWNDMFYMATRYEERWVDPSIERDQRAGRSAMLMRSEQGAITLQYDLNRGRRSYLIGSQPAQEERRIVENELIIPGPAQHMQMRHSDYPLDLVKDYVLVWDAPPLGQTGFISPEHVKALLANYTVSEKALTNARKATPSVFSLETSLPLYLATLDPELERTLIQAAIVQTQDMLDIFLKLEKQITVPMAPHHVARFQTVCNMISAIYDSPQWTAEEKAKVNAQIAFLGYLFNRDSYCSTARGFASFPNMTACVYGTRAAIASVLPGHPMRTAWLTTAVADLRREFLDHWVDAQGHYNGSRIESLTYSRLTFDLVLGAVYRVYRSGADPEAIFHPAIKQFGLWHANTSTPRDERLLGWRHDPPVGNNYNFDLSPALYAMLAFMWKDRDPEFAGQMKWMQMEQGNKQVQAIGGFTPSFAGYRKLFMANEVPAVTPNFVSNVWNETSVILRSHYNDELENMLYLIAGNGHSHYDQDSGSVTLFGKGQIIADDFGYYSYAPPTDHNMIDSPMAPGSHLMKIDKFTRDEVVDYVRGSKRSWLRRIQHIKHAEPKGPNYFVIHDGLNMTGPATWRMWLIATDVELHNNMAIARGLFNVDSELHFAKLPKEAKLTKEEMTRSGYGLDTKGKFNRHDNTQTGVIIQSNHFQGLLTLVFPRLKDEQPPVVTAIADGNGFKIVTPQATDYVFMANKAIEYSEGPLKFQGTAGFVRVAGNDVTLRLNEGGAITYGEHHIQSDEPAPTRSTSANVYPDGELESGKWSIMLEKTKSQNYVATLEQGTPPDVEAVADDAERYYQKVVFTGAVGRPIYLARRAVFIDPSQTYRVRVTAYLPAKGRLFLSSYGSDIANKQFLIGDKKTWGWGLVMQGPTNGFQTFETTLGPEGSGAKHTMHPGLVALNPLSFRVYESGNTFYIRAVDISPVDLNAPTEQTE